MMLWVYRVEEIGAALCYPCPPQCDRITRMEASFLRLILYFSFLRHSLGPHYIAEDDFELERPLKYWHWGFLGSSEKPLKAGLS